MKKILSVAALVAMTAAPAFANENYTLAVSQGGVNYNCSPTTETINGVLSRRCVRADAVSGAQSNGLFEGGLSTTAAIAAGILTLVVIAAAVDGDDDTPTNGST